MGEAASLFFSEAPGGRLEQPGPWRWSKPAVPQLRTHRAPEKLPFQGAGLEFINGMVAGVGLGKRTPHRAEQARLPQAHVL